MSATPITSASGLASAAAAATPSSSSAASSTSSPANEDIFLQVLVAQLKYQDPSNPASGTEFVTQLATFSSLQEDTESASDLDSILGLMQSSAASTAASTGATAGSTGTAAASTGTAAASAAATAAAAAAASATATDLASSTSPTSSTGF